MIERTVFDLRIAEQRNVVAEANRSGWAQAPAPSRRRVTRAALAGVLRALARRLDPAGARGMAAAA